MNKIWAISFMVISIILSGCMLPLMMEDSYIRKSQAEAEKYVKEHPWLDENIKNCILNNNICVGMAKEQVKLLTYYEWREHRIEPTSKYGAEEVWIYKRTFVTSDLIKHEYLYFKNDTLIKIEETRNKE